MGRDASDSKARPRRRAARRRCEVPDGGASTEGKRELPFAWALLFVAAVALVPYLRTLDFDFVYDDHAHIVRNSFLSDTANLKLFLSGRYFDQQFSDQARPVLLLSHFLDLALGAAGAAHLQSALWHAAAAALVAALSHALGFGRRLALGAGVLFGVHPALAEAVAGVSNREDVLATVFVLAALGCAVRGLQGRRYWLMGALVAYALALGSKEVAVMTPALFALALWASPRLRRAAGRRTLLSLAVGALAISGAWLAFQLRLGTPGLLRDAGRAPLQHAAMTQGAPLAAAPVAALALTASAPGERHVGGDGARSVDALSIAAFRMLQLGAGYPTSSEYDLAPFQRGWVRLLGAGAIAGALALGVWGFRHDRRVLFGVGWVALATLPVSLPTLLINPVADRYLYLPAVGACVLLSWLVSVALPRRIPAPRRRTRTLLLTALAALYFVLGLASIGHWRSDVTLHRHALRFAPHSARLHSNLGAALLAMGRLDEAQREFERAAELDPALLAAHFNLGLLAERTRRAEQARAHYRAGLSAPALRGERELRERVLSRYGALALRQRAFDELHAILEQELTRTPDSSVARVLRQRLAAARPPASGL